MAPCPCLQVVSFTRGWDLSLVRGLELLLCTLRDNQLSHGMADAHALRKA